jgi:hypothetical protein
MYVIPAALSVLVHCARVLPARQSAVCRFDLKLHGTNKFKNLEEAKMKFSMKYAAPGALLLGQCTDARITVGLPSVT